MGRRTMVTRWEQGRATIEQLIQGGRLSRVPANTALAAQYLALAEGHLSSSRTLASQDPVGAFGLAYDAARLSLASLLIVQGLRARGEGAHAVLLESVLAQCEPPPQFEFRQFQWMRRLRNESQYPDLGSPSVYPDDVEQGVFAAEQILLRSSRLVEILTPF